MIGVLQRVSSGKVEVDAAVVGEIRGGFVVLLGVHQNDQQEDAHYLARRIAELRVFEDPQGRMNRDLEAVGGSVLAVPQFTLLAGLRKGRRPDFLDAAEPALGRRLFECFVDSLKQRGVTVETGRFGATMKVTLVNEGPATFVFDTHQLRAEPRRDSTESPTG